MKLIIVVFTVFISANCFSQTKMVAHRSHSGSNTGFTLNGTDNFGATPEMIERWRKYRDSIRRADSTIKADSISKNNKEEKGLRKDTLKGSVLPSDGNKYSMAAAMPVARTEIIGKENNTLNILFWVISFLTASAVVLEFASRRNHMRQ